MRVDGTRDQEAPYVKWIIKKNEVDGKIKELEEKVAKLKTEILSKI